MARHRRHLLLRQYISPQPCETDVAQRCAGLPGCRLTVEYLWLPEQERKAICIAGYFGINPPGFVAQVVALAFGLASSSVFPVIVMGIFNKRMNKEGAIAGMIVGLGSTMAYMIYFTFMGGSKDDLFLGISTGGFGFVGMILNFIVAYVVSMMTPPPPAEIQEMVENIRVPRGAGEAHAH